jgi:very-short-patch-repair endonuclease
VVTKPQYVPVNDHTPGVVDFEIARRAERQHGVLSRRELLDAGIGERLIDHRLKVGRLHRVHRGVYAVGFVARSPLALAMAAVLACGPEALLSHRSAAALWDIDPTWRSPVEVTTRSRHRHRGVIAHRSRTLEPSDRTSRRGIPVTTPARTVVDLADVLDDLAFARVVNEALVRRRISPDDLAALTRNSDGRAAGRLQPFVEHADAPTRSAFEDAFLAFLQRHALPRPHVNQRVAGYEVDMLWRAQQLIAELDGRRFHEHPRSFETDRERDANLLAAGYRVVRVTWRRLMDQPEREAERLRALLSA